VHPSIQGMGYGTRAIEMLYRFYNGELITLHNDDDDDDDIDQEDMDEEDNTSDDDDDDDDDDNDHIQEGHGTKASIHKERLKPKKELPPLLVPLSEMKVPRLDWIGTSFGLTLQLHKFWSRAMMKMLYIRQTKNELTGEHSVIMIRTLPNRTKVDSNKWIESFVHDTRRRFVTLLGGSFRDMEIRQAVSVLDNLNVKESTSRRTDEKSIRKLSADELDYYMTPHDLKRLELYGRNLCDHHIIADLIPTIARLYYLGKFDSNQLALSSVQSALICGIGLQQRNIDSLTKDLNIPATQVLAMFNKSIRKISIALNMIVEDHEKKSVYLSNEQRQKAEKKIEQLQDVTEKTLEEDVKDAADDAMMSLRQQQEIEATLPTEISEDRELMRYVVKGSEQQWKQVLSSNENDDDTNIDDKLNALGTIQIKSVREKRKVAPEDNDNTNNMDGSKKKLDRSASMNHHHEQSHHNKKKYSNNKKKRKSR
jgi:N-acetyltransferase 10